MAAAREPQEMKVPDGLHEGALVAGKYRIGRVLGAGGMGLVLAARHETLGTALALKVIHKDSLRDKSIAARFVQEGRAAAHLRSEHVVRVHDLGTLDDGTPFLAMEQLDGVDLGALLDSTPRLGYEEAVEIIRQTCDALSEAHGLGIVHRDLKPQNLFLVQRPGKPVHVKVLDFGIAKFLSQEQFQLQIATHSAAIMGSPIYMAPEQMRAAKGADGRSDLWSVGVIFYQLLVGKVPFEAESLPELCAMVLTEKAPQIDARALGIPEGLSLIVDQCLQTDPSQRFQTADEIIEALSPYVTTKPVMVPEVGKLARARDVAAAPRSTRIAPQGDGKDIRPDGATIPATRGSQADIHKTVLERGAAKLREERAESEPAPATVKDGGAVAAASARAASVVQSGSTTARRRQQRRTIADVLAEDQGPVSQENNNGRTLFVLLLLAVVAGGGAYMWKFHKAPLAPLRDTIGLTDAGAAHPKPDDPAPLPKLVRPGASDTPKPALAPSTPNGGKVHSAPSSKSGALVPGLPSAPTAPASAPTPPQPPPPAPSAEPPAEP